HVDVFGGPCRRPALAGNERNQPLLILQMSLLQVEAAAADEDGLRKLRQLRGQVQKCRDHDVHAHGADHPASDSAARMRSLTARAASCWRLSPAWSSSQHCTGEAAATRSPSRASK